MVWYPPHQQCKFLKPKHHPNSSYKKSIIERTIKYIKGRPDNLTIIFYEKKITIVINCRKLKAGPFDYNNNR
jgi:hypothetical protein